MLAPLTVWEASAWWASNRRRREAPEELVSFRRHQVHRGYRGHLAFRDRPEFRGHPESWGAGLASSED
jgi:hypothetical protein